MRRPFRIFTISSLVILASGALLSGAYFFHFERPHRIAEEIANRPPAVAEPKPSPAQSEERSSSIPNMNQRPLVPTEPSASPKSEKGLQAKGLPSSGGLPESAAGEQTPEIGIPYSEDPVPNERHVNLDQQEIKQVKTQFLSSAHQPGEPGWQLRADSIISLGLNYLGTPYQFGAKAGQTAVFDCSSFMKYIYGIQGIKLPRDSREQSLVGSTVNLEQLREGDMVFFTTPARIKLTGVAHIGHVGIYLGNGLILHTFRPGIGVTISKLQGPWLKRFVEARRIIP